MLPEVLQKNHDARGSTNKSLQKQTAGTWIEIGELKNERHGCNAFRKECEWQEVSTKCCRRFVKHRAQRKVSELFQLSYMNQKP